MSTRTALKIEDRHAALAFMRQSVLFRELSDAQLQCIVAHTDSTTLQAGQVLFEQQSEARDIFMLESGQVKLSRLSPDGQEKVIDLISPGTTFAEAIMFSGQHTYPVTATALVPSQLLCFDTQTYTDILRASTEACFAVMAQMSRRLHWQLAEIDRLTLHNATFRVASYLLEQVPAGDSNNPMVALDTPKHVIASRLSMTPETLSRTLSRLSRDGLIHIDDSRVLLKNIQRLRDYTQGGNSSPT